VKKYLSISALFKKFSFQSFFSEKIKLEKNEWSLSFDVKNGCHTKTMSVKN
jgi:hypothetical protein